MSANTQEVVGNRTFFSGFEKPFYAELISKWCRPRCQGRIGVGVSTHGSADEALQAQGA